jgi:hypothetical protein
MALAGGLIACAPPPKSTEQPKRDPAAESWYGPAIEQLASMNRRIEDLTKAGKFDEASAVITQAQRFQARLLEAPHPPLAAMEAASDLDDLYGHMLLRNGRPGWARTFFQNNVVRWRTWKPRTPDTEGRLRAARDAVAECEQKMQ